MYILTILLMVCIQASLELPYNINEMDQFLDELDGLVHSLRQKRQDAEAAADTPEPDPGSPEQGPGTAEGSPGTGIPTTPPQEFPGVGIQIPGITMMAGCPGMMMPGIGMGMPGGFGGGGFQFAIPGGFMNFQGFGGGKNKGPKPFGPPQSQPPARISV